MVSAMTRGTGLSVVNVHGRWLPAPPAKVGELLDALATEDDPIWPRGQWQSLRLDGPLRIGAAGGHGPIRYHVAAYVPGQWVRFAFDRPTGFTGFHEFTALPERDG